MQNQFIFETLPFSGDEPGEAENEWRRRRRMAAPRRASGFRARRGRSNFAPSEDFQPDLGINPQFRRRTRARRRFARRFDFEGDFETETGAAAPRGAAIKGETGSALDVLSPSELKAVRITSTFETGRAGGFGGLTGNFDGQGLSFGLLNFTVKAGSLIPLLQEFIKNHPARYAAVFGADAEAFREIVFAVKPDPKNPRRRIRDVERQMDFVNRRMNLIPKKAPRNAIVEPWKTYFGRLERDPAFRKIQVKAVRRALDRARYWFDKFGFRTERGFVFMFDLVSSHGGYWLNAPKFKGRRIASLNRMLEAERARLGRAELAELETMRVIANMIADASLAEWRKDARTRKLWFVDGAGKVHGDFWDIKKHFGVTDAPPVLSGGGKPSTAARAGQTRAPRRDRKPEPKREAPKPTDFKIERAAHGDTLFVKIDLGIEGTLNQTAIYLPKSFKPGGGLKMIIYLHGHKTLLPGGGATIEKYLDAKRFPYFGLREEVAAGNQNVVFVAPTLGDVSQAGSLARKGGFDAYLERVLAALNEHLIAPRFGAPVGEVREIVMAVHSGGGAPLWNIVNWGDRNAAKIKECWCFDSMYGAVGAAWARWAAEHPDCRLYVYYGPSRSHIHEPTGRLVLHPLPNAEAIACEAKKKPLTNVCLQPSRAKKIGGVDPHFWVPIVHLRERLLNLPCQSAEICPRR